MILGSPAWPVVAGPLTAVDVIFPNRVLVSSVVGAAKLAVFGKLKASNRNSMYCRSRIGNLRESATFTINAPGPRRLFLPEFPNWPVPLGTTHAVLNHWLSDCVKPWVGSQM